MYKPFSVFLSNVTYPGFLFVDANDRSGLGLRCKVRPWFGFGLGCKVRLGFGLDCIVILLTYSFCSIFIKGMPFSSIFQTANESNKFFDPQLVYWVFTAEAHFAPKNTLLKGTFCFSRAEHT